MTRIGAKRHLITIQEPTETQDTDGAVVQTWSDYAVLWASIEPISGREYFGPQAETAKVSHRIRTRYLSGITTKMRIATASRTFDIEAVIDPQERTRELELMCIEVVQ